MRRSLISAGTVVTAVTAASLLLAPAASATGNPKGDPKGDNGTVKIHDAKTGEELRKNEPKVCTFYLDAFGFDAGQKVDWQIKAWAKNDQDKGTVVKTGVITLDADGHERTEDMTLPDGQYKLFWDFEGKKGAPKHKVFKTDCEPGTETPGTETPGTETPGTETPGTETPGTETPGTETPGTETPGSSESPSPNAPGEQGGKDTGDSDGNLAETGSGAPVGVLAAVAVALAGVGGFLVTRRRKAQQH
ncbi:LPXTG cell wall anchor domain-containing protein [Streptomyces sp. NPDC053755]|uniref:LPXTG cell wall anchor domain-containing protein n=1 Tax=Streptomyces sp. NPDC053755 TaxID=3155815 RepID=UPI0034476CCF